MVKKKKDFGAKAKTILSSSKKDIEGIGDFLKDSDSEKPIERKVPPRDKPTEAKGSQENKKNKTQPEKKEKLEVEPPKIERHGIHLEEELSEKIRVFQFVNKEKNKTRFFKILLNDFFSKSEDKQKQIYQKWLKKIEQEK